jgi:hypothetical protein
MRLPQIPPTTAALAVPLVGFIVSPQFLPTPPPLKIPALIALGVLVVIGLAEDLADGENLKQNNIQNRQQKKTSTAVPDGQWPVGNYDPVGRNNVTVTLSGSRRVSYPTQCSQQAGITDSRTFSMVGNGSGIVWTNTQEREVPGCPFKVVLNITARPKVGGIPDSEGGGMQAAQPAYGNDIVVPYSLTTTITPWYLGTGVIPFPKQVPQFVGFGTWIDPLPAPLPQRRTLPQPVIAPPEPEVLPDYTPIETPGIKQPKAPPIIKPTPRITPKAPPDLQPTGPDGKPLPKPNPQPQQTEAWQEVPWPGTSPIGSPAQQPRPNLIGIASELGKLEQKLAKIGGTPAPSLDFSPLVDLLNTIIDTLSNGGGGGDSGYTDYNSYLFSPPYDEAGVGLAEEKTYEFFSDTYGPATIARLDAIADALQAMAAWRVKLSKGNAVRPNVTLTAYGTPDP